MICPVEIASDLSALRAARVGDHGKHGFLLNTGHALHTLEGHSHFVLDVAVTADGARAVSASGDRTLKIWDLERRKQGMLQAHSHAVNGVAVTLSVAHDMSG